MPEEACLLLNVAVSNADAPLLLVCGPFGKRAVEIRLVFLGSFNGATRTFVLTKVLFLLAQDFRDSAL